MWPFKDSIEKDARAIAKRFKCPVTTQTLPPGYDQEFKDHEALLRWITRSVPEGSGQFSFGASNDDGIWLLWTPECEPPELNLTVLHELGHYVCQWTVRDPQQFAIDYVANPVPYEVEAWRWTEDLLPEYRIGKQMYTQVRDYSIGTYEQEMKMRDPYGKP